MPDDATVPEEPARAAAPPVDTTLADLLLDWLDEGSFRPAGALLDPDPDADELVAGLGSRHGHPVAVFASRPGKTLGAIGVTALQRIQWALEQGRRRHWPVVGLMYSSGARVEESMTMVCDGAEMLARLAYIEDSETPLLMGIDGPCIGLSALIAVSADLCVMTETGYISLAGPKVVKAGTGGAADGIELGGVDVHKESGQVHSFVPTAADLLGPMDEFLDAWFARPHPGWTHSFDGDVGALVPDDERKPFNIHKVIEAVFDDDSFWEYQGAYGKPLVTGFATAEGRRVAVLASNPLGKAGALDVASCRKGKAFVDIVGRAGLPLISFLDCPGGLPGVDEARRGILKAYMGLNNALNRLRTIRVSFIVRRLYGGTLALNGAWRWDGDLVYAWPQAMIGIMSPKAMAQFKSSLKEDDLAQERLRRHHAHMPGVGATGFIDDVVDPADTRRIVVETLRAYERTDVTRWS